jgi:sigma-B regulation protein RsbU (phosphoserine phosphatase)
MMAPGGPELEILAPTGGRTSVPLEPIPFLIGRQDNNHLVLRDNRASRNHARIVYEGDQYWVEDLNSRNGITVNGAKVVRAALVDGAVVGFGMEESYELIFRTMRPVGVRTTAAPSGLKRLRSILEVARTLSGSLSTDHVLASLLEAAMSVTGCERGFVLLREGKGLAIRIGRDAAGAVLGNNDLQVPPEVLCASLDRRRELLSMTLEEYGHIVCVPLLRVSMAGGEETAVLGTVKDSVGVLYLESRQSRADLSGTSGELLQSLAVEASMILENARLIVQERLKERMERELDLARTIQRDLLPDQFPATGWFRACGVSVSSAQVGGDYFDLMPVGEDRWAAVLADVSGKGVSSALLASFLQGVFLAATGESTSAVTVLERVNRFLLHRTNGEKYATLVLVTIDKAGRLVWVNGGHCRPLLWRRTGEVFELRSAGLPVGMLEEATWETYRQQLLPGDLMVLYSDGCSEARNAAGEMFGVRRVGETLLACAPQGAQAVAQGLRRAVETFAAGEEQADDLTVLVVEYHG